MDYLWGTPVKICNLRPGFSDFAEETRLMKEALPQNVDYNLHNVWEIPEFKHLKLLFQSEIQKFSNDVAIGDGFWFYDAYVNYHHHGMNNTPHKHPGAKALAIYCLDAPEDSGDLLLHDPRGAVDWDNARETSNRGIISDSRTFVRVPPIPGMLVLCPAYVVHSVETNLSKDPNPRITISADLYSRRVIDYLKTK
jgi:uncharacterized protein (TIGR02466 family)